MDLSDASLDQLRGIGDPPLDALLQEHLASSGSAASEWLRTLFLATELPQDSALVAALLAAMPPLAITDPDRLARGQRLFELFGPEVLLILGSYALPLAFAAGNGVQVIHRTRRIQDDAVRRLCDTAQMVINVMRPGELGAGGVGLHAIRKVRLIHALIRNRVQFDPSQPWPASWGTPINQEDLLGTLMSFSAAVLHGLKRMGAVISSADADDFIYAWCVIGRGLGIVDTALPHDEASAAALALRIGTRQHRATSEGTALANQLLQAVETLFPIRGYALSLTHYFLADTVFGANVAQVLDLPPPNWTRHIVRLRAAQKRQILRFIDHVPGARTRRRFLAKRFAQSLILLKRPDRASPFEVPSTWLGHWRIDMR